MKKSTRIFFILLLMLATVSTFVLMELDRRRPPEQRLGYRSVSVAGVTRRIRRDDGSSAGELSDTFFSLGTGESYRVGVTTDTDASRIVWKSSDSAVALVDSSGKVTAVAPGEAEITASLPGGVRLTSRVTVYDEPSELVSAAILALAETGSDEAMDNVLRLARDYGNAKSQKVHMFAALLQGLADFHNLGAKGTGSASDLWRSLRGAMLGSGVQGLDEAALRRAALAAYCQGEKSAADMMLSFTGDCTFGHFNENEAEHMFPAVYARSGSATYPFDLTKEVFGADDITMINFEGTLTQSKSHKNKQFYFRGDPSYVDILTHSSVEAVTLENNHSHDYYDKGLNDTKAAMDSAGIPYTAYPEPAVLTVGENRVVMLGLCMTERPYSEEFRSYVQNIVNEYRSSHTVIVMNVHWGVEGSHDTEDWQQEAARDMIDAGVDLVIGHHPHVTQGIEVYKGHYIVYSLGNFAFGGNSAATDPACFIFRVGFTRNANGNLTLSRVSIVPCYTTSTGGTSNNFQPVPLFGKEGKAVMDKLVQYSGKLEDGVRSLTWNRIP